MNDISVILDNINIGTDADTTDLFDSSYLASSKYDEFESYVPTDLLVERVKNLDDYSKYATVATFDLGALGGPIPNGALTAFERLASTLKLDIIKDYDGFKLRTEKPYADQRNTVLARLYQEVKELRDKRTAEFDSSGIPV